MIRSIESFGQEIRKVLLELSKYPLSSDENKMLTQTLREFTKVLSSDQPGWMKNTIKIYEENGMNPFDEKSIEDKLKDDPYKALELSAKVIGIIPFFKVLSECS